MPRDRLARAGGALCLILLGCLLAPTSTRADEETPADPNQPSVQAPTGTAGRPASASTAAPEADDFLPIEDRWRIGFPDWDRYAHGRRGAAPYAKGRWYDPYRQNVLKGDYPIWGRATFLNLTVLSDTVADSRSIPTPSGISGADPGNEDFFGGQDEFAFSTNLLLSADLFHGAAAFKPVDWRVRVTPVANFNYLNVEERGVVNIDVREGDERDDGQVGLQEGFAEVKLLDVSPTYDVISLRAGVQGFLSDFRGFIFADNEAGARLFGSWGSNRSSWNLAYFRMIEKDTNSLLNTSDYDGRHQEVFIANLFRQDFLVPGYTASLSVHVNNDRPGFHFDTNGFLVRPAAVGSLRPHDIGVTYVGWTGSGHIDRLNLTHALYHVSGEDSENPIAGRKVDVDAWMGALEVSMDRDWLRFRGQIFWASGDDDPRDSDAEGFDAVFDNPQFAGAGTSFWVRQGIPLTGTKVKLVGPASLLPSLRSSKDEGQANFVNPGILLAGGGIDAELTPSLKATANANVMRFDDTSSLELLLFQDKINRFIGVDMGLGCQWRPWLNNNFIVTATASGLIPGEGFKEMFSDDFLYSVTASVTVVY
ncbi:MAG TPA: hypothetical protein VFG76_08155 [Candidatus Polarisedimenticolia bacterium]|nr:hypothetical protein [Candidatus Polarisedimenticolia bacterium]